MRTLLEYQKKTLFDSFVSTITAIETKILNILPIESHNAYKNSNNHSENHSPSENKPTRSTEEMIMLLDALNYGVD